MKIKTMSTKNLLRFYRAERKRMFKCDYWINTSDEEIDFLNKIKMELNTREHID